MRALFSGFAIFGLSACSNLMSAPVTAPPAAASVSEGDAVPATSRSSQPLLSTEVLPSFDRTGRVKMDAPLLQRPKPGSVVLGNLPAAAVVKILGTLDNADGHWVSVSLGDLQGWVRAAEITLDP